MSTLPLFPDEPISPTIAPINPVRFGLEGVESYSLRDRFEAFHRQNPDVYKNLRLIALDMKRRGIEQWGIAAIFERLRWLYKFQTRGDDYKLNNSWRAFYARMLMEQEPELREFFEVRVQKSEGE